MAALCARADGDDKPVNSTQDSTAAQSSSTSTTTQSDSIISQGGSNVTILQNGNITVHDSDLVVPHDSEISLPDPDVNSPTYDGSLYKIEPSNQPTPAEIKAEQQAQNDENNWLIRGYEEQVKEKSAANNETDSVDDPYQQILSNKDLTELAGLPPPAPTNPADVTTLHVSTDPAKNGPTLRDDNSQTSQDSPPAQTSSQQNPSQENPSASRDAAFKPLITPLTATDVAGLPNFYATLPGGPPPDALVNNGTTEGVPSVTDDSSFTDMPGLTAAKNQFKQGDMNYEVTFDPLPDDFQGKKTSSSLDKSDVTLTLPQISSDSTGKQAQLQLPIQATSTESSPPPPAPAKVVIHADPVLTNPKPISVPLIVAGRPQIQDPNDFLR
jgi:hypothetical protein